MEANNNDTTKGFAIVNLLEEADAFAKQVVPVGSNPAQFLDMKKAFICGLAFGFNLTIKGLDFENTENAEKQLEKYTAQMEDIEKHIMDGFQNFKD